MRRLLVLLLLAAAWIAGLLYAIPADAHPLGNFSVNHLAAVSVSADRVDVRYVLDQAEIPTFQERDLGDPAILARKRSEVARGLVLMVDGRRVALVEAPGGRISHPPGQGGLPLTRVELALGATLASVPRTMTLRDGTFAGRVGWKAIVARPGRGTAVRADVPSFDPTGGLRSYPRAKLTSPLDQRFARLSVAPGDGSLAAARSPFATQAHGRPEDGLAGVFGRAADGRGVLLFLLLAAFGWGAIHALSPGHGKTMVAAYLVGTRGTARHAIALGAVTTLTHTIGVFALALVTLALSQYILPEQLYPWLTLASGLLVVGIGLAVLRSRAGRLRARRGHVHAHPHEAHERAHTHGAHDHAHTHEAHDHAHPHTHARGDAHHHHAPEDLSWRGLVAMGASAGLIPCPSALVVLLGAIAQHQVGLGLLLVAVFSLGLAATLTALGLLVVFAGSVSQRLRGPLSGRLAGAAPALSAAVIVAAGMLLTVRAIPGVLGA
jgi:nickel/cobalt exporter